MLSHNPPAQAVTMSAKSLSALRRRLRLSIGISARAAQLEKTQTRADPVIVRNTANITRNLHTRQWLLRYTEAVLRSVSAKEFTPYHEPRSPNALGALFCSV